MVDEIPQGAVPVEPPRGLYPARLDEKGRLKLPVEFQRYLGGLPEKKLFVTSTERLMATVYPIEIWRTNEKLLFDFRENPKAAKRLWFTAQDLGSETEMDGQGRVQFSPELRRYLHIENQPVKVLVVNGAIQVMSEERYKQLVTEVEQTSEDDLEVMQRAGFK
jgi:MraZ protein